MRINITLILFTLFFGLMICAIGNQVLTPLIEFSLELFYGADVSHVSYNSPVNHGITHDFYKQSIYGGYEVVHPFKSIAIPTLFFTATISLLFFLRALLKRSKKETTNFNNKPDPAAYPISPKPEPDAADEKGKKAMRKLAIKLQSIQPTKAVKQRTRFFTIAAVFLFFWIGNTSFFQNKYKIHIQKEQFVHPFFPTDAIYIPNGKGDGSVWVADVNNDGHGQKFVKDGAFVEFDSTNIRVRSLNIKDDKWKDEFAYDQKGTLNEVKLIYGNNQLWLVCAPNFMRSFSISSKKITVKDPTDFKKQHPSLPSAIHEIDIDYDGGCRITLLDGQKLYYDFEIDSLNKTSSRLLSYYSKEYFTLNSADGDRQVLRYTNNPREKGFDYRAEMRRRRMENTTEERANFGEHYFIAPTILYQDSGICILSHRKDISENAPTLISGMHATDNSNNWSISASALSHNKTNSELSDVEIKNAFIDGPNLVFKTSVSRKTSSITAVSTKDGKVSWKYVLKEM